MHLWLVLGLQTCREQKEEQRWKWCSFCWVRCVGRSACWALTENGTHLDDRQTAWRPVQPLAQSATCRIFQPATCTIFGSTINLYNLRLNQRSVQPFSQRPVQSLIQPSTCTVFQPTTCTILGSTNDLYNLWLNQRPVQSLAQPKTCTILGSTNDLYSPWLNQRPVQSLAQPTTCTILGSTNDLYNLWLSQRPVHPSSTNDLYKHWFSQRPVQFLAQTTSPPLCIPDCREINKSVKRPAVSFDPVTSRFSWHRAS